MKFFKSLSNKLFGWYIGSLVLLSVFFYAGVHIIGIPHGTELFFLLFLLLAVIGFAIIYRITNNLTYLTAKIKRISHENLDERVEGIHREDELGELSDAFNNLLNRLDDAFKREQQFIGDVAHELNTPIATMRSGFEVSISQERKKEQYIQTIKNAIEETYHLSSTLKNVLDLAWSETPHEVNNFSKMNLSELMAELTDIVEKLAASKKLKVTSQLKKNVYIFGYKEKLARSLMNILENAVKYTPNAGKIVILLKKEKDNAIVIIKDTGQGILKKDIPHIFDRFYRGSETENIIGSGIGLSISQSIVRLHHGDIHVKSTPGTGTVFTIHVPLHK